MPQPNLYLINGEDEFLKKEETKKIEDALFSSPTQKDFNYAVFDAREADIEEIIKLAKFLPWQVSRRLIVVNNIEYLKSHQRDVLISYLKHPCPHTILVLTSIKIDRRGKFYQAVSKAGRIINVRLSSWRVEQWIKQEFRKYGKEISSADSSLLKEKVGADIRSLNQNIAKLILYTRERKEIKREDIEDVVSKSNLNTVFDLTTAIGKKDKKSALNILNNLFYQGKKIGEIMGMLFWQINRLQRGKRILQHGERERLTQELNISSFYVDDFINSTDNFSFSELRKDIELFAEADLQIKRGLTKPEIILEILVLKLCQTSLDKP
ncbi:MAG: DNA polymerase III subunit delta [Candidatus Omnitrophica bacterium 4484_213]|nr:MAG: DNA polymerase III subunit delta [Candidatus Omnitrophica bacterium 4484_213]